MTERWWTALHENEGTWRMGDLENGGPGEWGHLENGGTWRMGAPGEWGHLENGGTWRMGAPANKELVLLISRNEAATNKRLALLICQCSQMQECGFAWTGKWLTSWLLMFNEVHWMINFRVNFEPFLLKTFDSCMKFLHTSHSGCYPVPKQFHVIFHTLSKPFFPCPHVTLDFLFEEAV